MTPIPTWHEGGGCSSSDDENELEDLESQGNSTCSLYGSPRQDHPQDMAEDGFYRASRDFLESQRTECPSKGCPQHVYKRRFSSDCSISPTSLGETQGGSKGSNYGQEEDRLSGQSDISLYRIKAPTGHNLRPSSAGSAESMTESIGRFGDNSEYPTNAPTRHNPRRGSAGSVDSMPESIGQFGDSSEYPSESEIASSLGDSHSKIIPTESFQSHFLSPLSQEEMQHTPSGNGKMNSDASYEEKPGSLMGSVNLAGSATSQDLSNSKAQMPPSPGSKFGREESNSPFQWGGNQPLDQIQKSKKTSSAVLRSQFSGSFCPFSTPKSSTPKRLNQSRAPKKGGNMPAHSSSEVSKYGRGQLNYPLPDFSKVEPKVRFPKDEESYRPPKGKKYSRQFQGSTRPLIYKSPAEIVREVLLSSGDNSPQKASLPSYTVAKVPKEFKNPQQATELVQQLQEDYHKLLTKYAEAENTIDQLRLGAKVNLYSDPPKPSYGVQMGSMPHGTKVMSFTIPQAKMAEWQSTTNTRSQALLDSELSATQGDLTPSPAAIYPDPLTDGSGTPTQGPSLGDRLTQNLANEVAKFLEQVESFEVLVQEGRLAPPDQLKGFWRLKEEQDALEKAFLWARGEHRRMQQLQASDVPSGEFDPNREVEGEIFRLGMHLEELMDEIDDLRPAQLSLRTPPEERSHDSSAASPGSDLPTLSPALSAQAPVSTVRTPCPETPAVQNGAHTEVSSASSDLEDESPALPQPLQYKQLQMEQDFQSLTAQYHSIKLFPDAVKLEEDQEEKDSTQEVDGPIARNSKAFDPSSRRTEQEEGKHPNPLEECVEQTQSTQSLELQSSPRTGGRHLGGPPQDPVAQPHPPASKLTPPGSEQKQPASHQSSISSLAGSGVSGSLPLQKVFHSASAPQLEHRIVSPETDSGFVGSESSRVSPLTQTPEHRLSHASMSFGTSDSRRLPQPSTAGLPQAPSSCHPEREQLVVRVSSRLSRSGAQAQRSDPMPITPSKKWIKSFHHKPGPGTKMADLEGKGHDRAREQYSHGREDDRSPAPTPSDEGHQETTKDPLSSLISREVRDQAIRSLQQEVTRLRERIEASLNNPPRDTSSHNFHQATRARSRLAKEPLASGGYSHTSKSAERYQSDRGDATHNNRTVRLQLRSSSVPRERPRSTQTSESEQSVSRIQAKQSRAEEQSSSDGIKGGTRGKKADTRYFRGHYTDNALSKDPEELPPHDSIKKTQCPMCHRPRSPTEKDREPSGIDKSTQKGAALSSGPTRKSEQHEQPSTPPSLPHPPGVWYLASPLPPPMGATFTYVPPIPVVPCSSSTLYYSPVAPTSASSPLRYSSGKKPAEMRPLSQNRRAPSPNPGHRCLSELDLVDLDDLSLSLSRAVEAAKNVEFTTKQMSRSLSADLHRARGLRGSCLF
ncbi:microtubule organization protein AKNA isoform X1 [Notamacropus eugenii]|uniref:microtubule organization protein AKNA isoform X1 n=1 Tax=Notamacropus eugenii TaxID=9315 RepID=UPI003B678A97